MSSSGVHGEPWDLEARFIFEELLQKWLKVNALIWNIFLCLIIWKPWAFSADPTAISSSNAHCGLEQQLEPQLRALTQFWEGLSSYYMGKDVIYTCILILWRKAATVFLLPSNANGLLFPLGEWASTRVHLCFLCQSTCINTLRSGGGKGLFGLYCRHDRHRLNITFSGCSPEISYQGRPTCCESG